MYNLRSASRVGFGPTFRYRSYGFRCAKTEVQVASNQTKVASLPPLALLQIQYVLMSVIMPVAFDVDDIRTLSFKLELEVDNYEMAQTIRNSLPLYEEHAVRTVEKFLEKKFYNDILYIKEKLGKKFLVSLNSIGEARIKNIKFEDYILR